MTDLNHDQKLFAAGLKDIVFDEVDVYAASVRALHEGSAQVGRIPIHSLEMLNGLHLVLVIDHTGAALMIHPSHEKFGHSPNFSFVLKTFDGETLRSHSEPWEWPSNASFEVIPLPESTRLIGARLELVA